MGSYRVKTVCELTGIPRNTLVAWERRYHMLAPQRSEGGYRLYSDADVAYLRRLKESVDAGLSISEAIAHASPPVPTEHPPAEALWRELGRFLVTFDRAGAQVALRRVSQLPFEEAVTEVWTPLLGWLGRSWESGEITVAQEHYVAAVAREHLLAMFRSLDGGLGRGPHVVAACLPGEQHDLPLLCMTVRLALRGWRVTWLGADVPVGDLCACTTHQNPDLVALCSVARGDLGEVARLAREVRACAPRNTIVALGGPNAEPLIERSTPRLWFVPSLEQLLERWADHRAATSAAARPGIDEA